MDFRIETKRGEPSRDYKIDDLDLKRRSIEGALPAHFIQQYPKFVEFLVVYYDFLEAEEGLDNLINRLVDIRNPDIAKDKFGKRLKKEYGPDFPDFGTMTDATALKVFEKWYKSKGNEEAIEAYFRLFLNTEPEIVYPKDNMLRVSGGEWSESESRYLNQRGHLSETTMVIQDSTFYQIFSYLVRSGISISDWGIAFRELAHPAGWNVFGEVSIQSLAEFFDLIRSPTLQPGSQERNIDIIILGAVLLFAVGGLNESTHPFNQVAFSQFIVKVLEKSKAFFDKNANLDMASKNLLLSTFTIGGLGNITIEDFSDGENLDFNFQRPARINISV